MDKFKQILARIAWMHVFMFSLLYGGYCYYFQDMSEITAREAHVQDLTQKIDVLNKNIIQAKEFEKQIEEKKAALAELESQLRSKKAELPKSFDVPELLNDIFSEAQQVGLEVMNVTPDANEVKQELYASMKIDIQSRGTFLQMFIFLDRLSKLKRLVGVTSVQLTASSAVDRLTLKGTTGALSGKKLSGGEKTYRALTGRITLLAYRII